MLSRRFPAPRATRSGLLAPTLVGLILAAAACGGEDLQAADPPPSTSEEPVVIPEGMEEWAHLLGHNTPYQTLRDWKGERPEGLVTQWHSNGVKQGEGRFGKHSHREGPWTFWHANGQKRWEGTYENDVVVGLERAWYDDGTPNYEGAYVDGAREGEWSYWHPSGRPMWKGHFAKGKRHGSYRAWKADGSLDPVESGTYQNGVKIAEFAGPTEG